MTTPSRSSDLSQQVAIYTPLVRKFYMAADASGRRVTIQDAASATGTTITIVKACRKDLQLSKSASKIGTQNETIIQKHFKQHPYSTNTEASEGTGLGLKTVQKIRRKLDIPSRIDQIRARVLQLASDPEQTPSQIRLIILKEGARSCSLTTVSKYYQKTGRTTKHAQMKKTKVKREEDLAELITADPGRTTAELISLTGLTPSQVSRYLLRIGVKLSKKRLLSPKKREEIKKYFQNPKNEDASLACAAQDLKISKTHVRRLKARHLLEASKANKPCTTKPSKKRKFSQVSAKPKRGKPSPKEPESLRREKEFLKLVDRNFTPTVIFPNQHVKTKFHKMWASSKGWAYYKKLNSSSAAKRAQKFYSLSLEQQHQTAYAKLKPFRESRTKGFGVEAAAPIKSNTILGIYTASMREDDGPYSDYAFGLATTGPLQKWILDAQDTGNILCLVNSTTPDGDERANTEASVVYLKETPVVIFTSCRDIAPGESITIDYGKEYWQAKQAASAS